MLLSDNADVQEYQKKTTAKTIDAGLIYPSWIITFI